MKYWQANRQTHLPAAEKRERTPAAKTVLSIWVTVAHFGDILDCPIFDQAEHIFLARNLLADYGYPMTLMMIKFC